MRTEKELTELYSRVFGSEEGVEVLYHIYHHLCYYDAPAILSENGQGRRIVYSLIRRYLDPKVKAKVEVLHKDEPPPKKADEELHPFMRLRQRGKDNE